MKLALILATAIGVAPPAPTTPLIHSDRIYIRQGAELECQAPGGCFVATQQGLADMVSEVIARALKDAGCRRENGL